MTYITVDVPKEIDDAPGILQPKDKVTIIRVDDVSVFPARDSKKVYISDNIAMKSNKNMMIIYVTPGTIDFEGTAEGEADSTAIMQKLAGSHPGYALPIAEFMANNLNQNLAAVIEFCDGSTPLLFGSACAPLKLVPNVKGSKGDASSTFEMSSIVKGPCIAHYGGTLTLATDNEIAADDVTPSVAEGTGRYVIPDDNAAANPVTSLDDAVKGMVITLVGSGGTHPSTITAAATEFILEGGVTWTSTDGAEITFEVFAAGVFIERSRA